MKKYIAPKSVAVDLCMEGGLLSNSNLSSDGGANSQVGVSRDEFGGSFRSREKGWNSELWSED